MWDPEFPPFIVLSGIGIAVLFFALQLAALFSTSRRIFHWLPVIPVGLGLVGTVLLGGGLLPIGGSADRIAVVLSAFFVGAPTACAALGIVLACLCWKVIDLCR